MQLKRKTFERLFSIQESRVGPRRCPGLTRVLCWAWSATRSPVFIQTVNPVTPSLQPIFAGYIPRPSVSPRDVLHQFCPRSGLEITLIARHFIVVSLSMNLQMLLIQCREFTFTAMHHGSVTLVMNLPQMTPQQIWSLQNPLTNVALVMLPADVSLQIVFAAAFDIT